MNKNFWQQLREGKNTRGDAPFFVLAPMYDVTDSAFRQMFVRHGKPDVMYTEFTSAEGIMHPEGAKHTAHLLRREDNESPLVAHLFSAHPTVMRAAARHAAQLGFDGIDINMGCPVKNIQKQGCGAAMILNPENAVAVVAAAKQGVRDAGQEIPVSVKTRIGYNKEEIDTWIPVILSGGIDALAVHLRTKKEMSNVPAHWELMPQIVALRDTLAPQTVIVGNGDVQNIADGDAKARTGGCDGIMVGRSVFGNPWFFDRASDGRPPSTQAHLAALMEHVVLYEKYFDGVKNFAVMKHHFKAYVNGFEDAAQLRGVLMETQTASEALDVLRAFRVKQ